MIESLTCKIKYCPCTVKEMETTKTFFSQEVSSMILSNLKLSAERHLGQTVTKAVITVPAYFNNAQRQATKDAASIAGLTVRQIINEPTAAALAYGLDKKYLTENSDYSTGGCTRQAEPKQAMEQNLLVFDLGGGTFDVKILTIVNGTFQVKSMCLQDSKLEKCLIDDIVLVVGSTWIPKIQKLLTEYFDGKGLKQNINADETVAYGAAIQGAILDGNEDEQISNVLLVDVTPLSLGIATRGEILENILRNSTTKSN